MLDLAYVRLFLDQDSPLFILGAAVEKAARMHVLHKIPLTRHVTRRQVNRRTRHLAVLYSLRYFVDDPMEVLRNADRNAEIRMRLRAVAAHIPGFGKPAACTTQSSDAEVVIRVHREPAERGSDIPSAATAATATACCQHGGSDMSELTYLPIFRSVLRHLLGVGGTRMAGATRTYGAIMTLVDSDDDSFVIPYERIAERAGLSKQIVTRHMTYLTISGWLTRVGRFGRTKNTKYRLTLTRRTCQELARLENPLGRLQEIAQYNEVLSAILTAAEQKYVLDTLDDWKFFRFPLVHRDKIGALSHCAVLSLIYWRCGERDTGVLADESRHGAPYVTHMLGLTYDQASGALTALSIGAAPVISYDSAKYIVRIQSVNIDGQESDQSISTTQTVPTMPTTPSIPIVGVATILSDVGMFCDSNVDGVGSVIHEVGSVIHEVGSVIADGRVCDSDKVRHSETGQ